MKSLKLKLYEYKQGLNFEQSEVEAIVNEHINLCDEYSEKEIYQNLSNNLDKYKYFESVTPLLEEIDNELSKNSVLYSLKDLYAKINRKPDTFLYETTLNVILNCINESNDQDRTLRILNELKLYEWVPEVKMFLYEMSSVPQEKQNFISNGGKVNDVHSVVFEVKEGYLTYVAERWVLMNNEGINFTLLENHITDEVQLKKLRLLEQAVNSAEFNDSKITFKISEELVVTFDTKDKKIYLNESESDKGTTLETLFNSPIVPFMGKAFYPILNEAYNNLDKFMKIDTIKHVYNLVNAAFECYVFNFKGNISQYRVDKYAGSSYYKFENAMPLIENVMQELGADLTFFFENVLSDEIKAKVELEKEEKVLLEKLNDVENAILTIKAEGNDFIKENKAVENLYNSVLASRHKITEQLKDVKNKKSQLYK